MRILIVGEINGYIGEAAAIAIKNGGKILHAPNADMAMDILLNGKGAEIIWYDLGLMKIDRFIEDLSSQRIVVPVIACGVKIQVLDIERAIAAGAKDYINLPPDPEMINVILRNFSQKNDHMIFKSSEMNEVVQMAKRVAKSNAGILITGESGTGKEVMANFIHQSSTRSNQSFIALNCAAIPENLLESELFGHEKGAFTGALSRRIGKFEEAHGGTIFLDEISEMHPRLQAKLLRAIQERVIDRVGGTSPIPVNIRIIATSNRDMEDAIKKGDFREDLYFRLNIVGIHLPSLRQRRDDILSLAQHFIKRYSEINFLQVKELSIDSINALLAYKWPGNVRELENCIHRGVLLANGHHIKPDDLFIKKSKSIHNPYAEQIVGKTISQMEKKHILVTLESCNGNRTNAASILGISIRTLRNKLKEYEHYDAG